VHQTHAPAVHFVVSLIKRKWVQRRKWKVQS